MKTTYKQSLITAATVCALAITATIAHAADALPSWNDGAAKKSDVEFVATLTVPFGLSSRCICGPADTGRLYPASLSADKTSSQPTYAVLT